MDELIQTIEIRADTYRKVSILASEIIHALGSISYISNIYPAKDIGDNTWVIVLVINMKEK